YEEEHPRHRGGFSGRPGGGACPDRTIFPGAVAASAVAAALRRTHAGRAHLHDLFALSRFWHGCPKGPPVFSTSTRRGGSRSEAALLRARSKAWLFFASASCRRDC